MRRGVALGTVIAVGALSMSVRVILSVAQGLPEKYKGYNPARTRLRGNIELIFKELQ